MIESVDDIFGMIKFLCKNSTVSEFRSAIFGGIYALCNT